MPRAKQPPAETFGARLARLRRARSLSQTTLAVAASLSRPHLSEIERDRKKPGLATIRRLATALGVEANELL